MLKINNNIKCAWVFVLTGFVASCEKFVELDPPTDRVSSEVLFTDSANAVGAIAGMYINFLYSGTNPDFFNGGLTLYTGLAG
ncbi:MAG: hypothetical protein J7497_06475, partial [Chitinophagaceae bacterium]|nr:hypothetical protein [Chitinophagaceae bacterium]